MSARLRLVPLLLSTLLACLSSPLAAADTVRMAFGEKIPPFCFPETDSGIEVEILREALAYRGHVMKPHYYPFARIPVAFKAGDVDAAMTDLGEDMEKWGAYYGDPAVFYDNVFISLKERHLDIKTPEDLRGLTVISFAGAAKRYPEWLDEVKKAGHYFEQNDQALQVLTLDRGRYDIVLSDRNIFKYFTLQLKLNKTFHPKAVVEQSFVKFNPMDYRAVFRDKKVRDDFNAGLKHLKDSGRFNAIYQKYLGDGKGG
ncbi:substrate-binding periplasmic protein [Duganella violaceipulchra]|uniref:ABC transporter substrate-binding protein n=1 Tax=Duganella violaceipulchra TaxID=2849652 RepID=A0AA41L239_9BURK|nr:ABC transporter substrate-binding protein [Duganella violaceicalia]MBV6321793.1 ABC transporter substrate-binding protein [Duganella violaceicalia]MCP2007213.1 polar amino acid transport system substrate-binding protein [Duganella violaceicalia]